VKGMGSLRWQSPELFEEEAKTMESDVYAFGMTIVEVLTGDVPFPRYKSPPSFIKAVHVHGERPRKEPECSPEGVSYARAWNVAERCWPADPKERISVLDAYEGLTTVDVEETIEQPDSPSGRRDLSLSRIISGAVFVLCPWPWLFLFSSSPVSSRSDL